MPTDYYMIIDLDNRDKDGLPKVKVDTYNMTIPLIEAEPTVLHRIYYRRQNPRPETNTQLYSAIRYT